jgi:hypothetical protein
VLLLKEAGVGVDVHEIEESVWEECAEELKARALAEISG